MHPRQNKTPVFGIIDTSCKNIFSCFDIISILFFLYKKILYYFCAVKNQDINVVMMLFIVFS